MCLFLVVSTTVRRRGSHVVVCDSNIRVAVTAKTMTLLLFAVVVVVVVTVLFDRMMMMMMMTMHSPTFAAVMLSCQAPVLG